MSYEIAEALVAIGGVGFTPERPITFKSGIISPIYCDNRKFPFWPKQWHKVIRGLESSIAEKQIAFDVIGGVEAAGIPHSAALGFAMEKPSIFIRKETKGYGARKRVEGGSIQGKRVLLIEDLVTTGSSTLSAVEALRDEGSIVTDCFSIISYGFPEALSKFSAAGVALHATTNFEEILAIAQASGTIDETGAESVREWLREPHSWAKKHGFSKEEG